MAHQEIYLEPNQDGSSFALTNSHIQIHTCRTYETARDSGNVKSTVLVDYRWDVKAYRGNLVTVHKDGDVLAYILHGIGNKSENRSGCAVRIYHRKSKSRALIKNFTGQAVDLSWAFTSNPLYLAIVDEGGTLFVYLVKVEVSEITMQKFFVMKRNVTDIENLSFRVVWCPYFGDEPLDGANSSSGFGEPSDGGLKSCGLLAIAYGETVDIVDLEPVIERCGHDIEIKDVKDGSLKEVFASFKTRGNILSLTLSPDATALAVATQGGEVIFYIMESLSEIREAHRWKPHSGRPVTTILFLDDITEFGKDIHFWKFALTASDDNRELKLWNCETWECYSTLRIEAPNASMEHTSLILTIDWTSNYLFLSDIERKSLYVVQISHMDGLAKYVSFSEFPLVQPALSLAVVEASKKRFRPFSPNGADLDRSEDEEDGGKVAGVCAALYAVNPKSLLELEIRFQPNVAEVSDSQLSNASSFKMDSFRDDLSDLSMSDAGVAPPASELSKVLMCGDDFTHNAKKVLSSSSPADSTTPVERTPTKDIDNDRQVSNSPSSQEVRTILSHSGTVSEETYTATAGGEAVDTNRPVTPVAHTLAVVGTPNNLPNFFGKSISSANMSEANSLIGQLPTNGALMDAVTKLSMQVERVVAVLQRQEDELQLLKTALSGQGDLFQEMSSVVQTSKLQIQNSEDVLRNCQMHVQSFRSDQFKQMLAQILQESVQMNLDTIVKSEIRSSVAPGLNDAMNKIKDGMQMEIAQKLTVADTIMRENIGKMVKSKPVVDAIGASAAKAIATEAHAAYKQAFESVVVPSFENASRNLFTQMNDIFRKGTTEYIEQMQRQITAARANTDELKVSLSAHMTTLTEQMNSTFDKQMNVLTSHMQGAIDKQMQASSSKMHESLATTMRGLVKEEISRALADNQQTMNDTMMRVLRSQAPTPVPSSPHVDRQQLQRELNVLLAQNNLNAAFQQALSAADLTLVTYVCSKVPPQQIFAPNSCSLQQPVILSLIQQLSTDLATQTDLKLKYLMKAITAIDTKSPTSVPANVTRVLGHLHKNLATFLENPANAAFSSEGKMLMMASQYFINN